MNRLMRNPAVRWSEKLAGQSNMICQPEKRIYEYGSDYGEGGGRDPTAVYPCRMQVRPPKSRKEDQSNDCAD